MHCQHCIANDVVFCLQSTLAKAKEYKRAAQVRSAADELYELDLAQAQQVYEADVVNKMSKMVSKHKNQIEALEQRCVMEN